MKYIHYDVKLANSTFNKFRDKYPVSSAVSLWGFAAEALVQKHFDKPICQVTGDCEGDGGYDISDLAGMGTWDVKAKVCHEKFFDRPGKPNYWLIKSDENGTLKADNYMFTLIDPENHYCAIDGFLSAEEVKATCKFYRKGDVMPEFRNQIAQSDRYIVSSMDTWLIE